MGDPGGSRNKLGHGGDRADLKLDQEHAGEIGAAAALDQERSWAVGCSEWLRACGGDSTAAVTSSNKREFADLVDSSGSRRRSGSRFALGTACAAHRPAAIVRAEARRLAEHVMMNEGKGLGSTSDRGYARPPAPEPQRYERIPEQKATGAKIIGRHEDHAIVRRFRRFGERQRRLLGLLDKDDTRAAGSSAGGAPVRADASDGSVESRALDQAAPREALCSAIAAGVEAGINRDRGQRCGARSRAI